MEPHGGLVIFHSPKGSFRGIIYWNSCPVCCKHSHSDRPPLCTPFHKHSKCLSHISYRAAMKDSLCELKRSPVPECLPHRAWPESDFCCFDNFVDFCAFQHISLTKSCSVAFFFKVFLWNGLWSAFTRKWYITGVTFQEENSFHLSCWVVSPVHITIFALYYFLHILICLLSWLIITKWGVVFQLFSSVAVLSCTSSICSVLYLCLWSFFLLDFVLSRRSHTTHKNYNFKEWFGTRVAVYYTQVCNTQSFHQEIGERRW